MEDMKIVTINETDSDSYYWDENRGELGYEDLHERLDADTTEKYVKELQKVLDKINDFPTATAYTL